MCVSMMTSGLRAWVYRLTHNCGCDRGKGVSVFERNRRSTRRLSSRHFLCDISV